LQDIRYGLRGLRRSPGFAFTAVATLALGIGATTAIFSAVYALLLHPLPYHDPDRLVWVAEERPGAGGAVSEPDMVAWRERGRPFESIAGYALNEYTLTGAGDSMRLEAALVSANFLSLLGVTPQIGRDLAPADDRPGSPGVALLSDALWRERFSADPRVVGMILNLDSTAYAVIGVLPPRFRFPEMGSTPQVLLALRAPGSSAFNLRAPGVMLQVVARVRPRDSLSNIQEELQSFQETRRRISAPLARASEGRMVVVPLQRHLAGDSRKPLIVLLTAVGLVLLIACANVANLQLVRAAARRHEVAVRGAIGGTRMRLARQSLTESLLLSAIAAFAGLAIGAFAIDAIRGWRSPALPWLASVSLDPYVLAFTMGIAVAAAVLFGAAPAITGSRANLMDAMKTSTSSGTRHQGPLRSALVAGEIALALVLLIASGLLVRSFFGLMRVDPGYDPQNVLTASLQLPVEEFAGPAGAPNAYRPILAFASQALPQLRALPSVRYAALAERLPIQQNHSSLTLAWSGEARSPQEAALKLRTPLVGVTPDFFLAMGTPIVQGRAFHDDDERSPGVAIVNRAFARQFFSGDAFGKRFHSQAPELCAGCAPGKPTSLLVVGVVADIRQQGVDRPAEPEIYVPFAQAPRANFHVVLNTKGNPGALYALLRSTVFALDHYAPVYDIASLERRLSESLAQRRLTMFLLSAFAALALLLAAVGVYGVISYAVLQRTQEIGIRRALGATQPGVLRLVLGQQARIILLGSAAGLVLAFALSGVMSSLLYGVKASDFITFALSWVLLIGAALLAAAAPALRAARADPSVALRNE